jgi:hypothetical protein
MSTIINREAIRQRQERAHAELSALCKGKRFQMSIPAQEDYDSDLLIGASLRDVHALLTAYAELLQVLQDATIDRLQLAKDRDAWEQRARDLESLCADRL